MCPQDAHAWLAEVGSDDEERPGVTELDDHLGFVPFDRTTADDAPNFWAAAVGLSFVDCCIRLSYRVEAG